MNELLDPKREGGKVKETSGEEKAETKPKAAKTAKPKNGEGCG